MSEVARIAVRYGFSGVELRATSSEPVHIGMSPAERHAVTGTLRAAGVQVLSIASYVKVADPGLTDGYVISDGIAHGLLAADLGATFLRVFPGGPTDTATDTATDAATDAAAVRRLAAIAAALADVPVTVALETHDSRPRGADVARILDRVPAVAAIWDVLHPWRAGETPADTWRALSDRIGYVQIKDVAGRDDPAPLPPGDGVLPLGDVASLLRNNDFRGFVSWEYERAWFPDQPPLAELAPRTVDNWAARWAALRTGS